MFSLGRSTHLSEGQRERNILNLMNILKQVLIATTTFFLIACGVAQSENVIKDEAAASREFEAMVAKVDAAQRELQNGRPEAFKALWSHADDITLSGGFGGTVEKGWE